MVCTNGACLFMIPTVFRAAKAFGRLVVRCVCSYRSLEPRSNKGVEIITMVHNWNGQWKFSLDLSGHIDTHGIGI